MPTAATATTGMHGLKIQEFGTAALPTNDRVLLVPLMGSTSNLPNPYGLQQQLNETMTPTLVPKTDFH